MYSFFYKSYHLLNMLLSLEYFSLMIFMNLYLLTWGMMEKYVLMYFLVFCVCEGAFGLSLLVSLVRFNGNDYVQSLFLTKC
uniref:NADH-ubiquinone oxidoreductase chain 4L n=1 Tax=Nepiomorpha sp. NespEL TaxID=1940904 RepID=A0A8K1ZG36_9NEOP|nr:NADH dehydrogenase subunit 4L [Nepiomorpha sp. NespEL]